MPRDRSDNHTEFAEAALRVIKDWMADDTRSLSELSREWRMGRNTLRAVVSPSGNRDDRVPTLETLRKVAKKLGRNFRQLEEEANSRLEESLPFGGGPFPATLIGPFLDSFLLAWPSEAAVFQQKTSPAFRVARFGDLPEQLHRSLTTRIKDSAFSLLNISTARNQALKHPERKTLGLYPWSITISPCFCLVGRVNHTTEHTFESYSDRVRRGAEPRSALLGTLISLKGSLVVAESNTDIYENTKALLSWGDANIKLMSDDEWRRSNLHPQIFGNRDEVVIARSESTPSSFNFLASNLLRDNCVVAGGASQLAAAKFSDRLQVLLTDRDILDALGDEIETLPWREARNIIVTEGAYLSPPEQLKSSQVFDRYLEFLSQKATSDPTEIVPAITKRYNESQGQSVPELTQEQCAEVLTYINVEKTWQRDNENNAETNWVPLDLESQSATHYE